LNVKEVAPVPDNVIYAVSHQSSGVGSLTYVPLAIMALVAVPLLSLPTLEWMARRHDSGHWTSEGARLVRMYFPALLILTGILVAMIFQSVFIDPPLTRALGWDATPMLHALEGDSSGWLQRLTGSVVADLYFYATYMLFFVVLFYGSVVYLMAADDGRNVNRLVVGYGIIFAVALPFFMLFPVNEVWTTNSEYAGYNIANGIPPYGYTDVRGVLFELGKSNVDASFTFSSVNNCFPSLHTAISFYVLLVAAESGRRAWFCFSAWVACSVVLATLYLGVHWLADVAAGMALAASAFAATRRLEVELEYPLKVKRFRWKQRGKDGGD
jgi:membrane-associated phospholipid phosphatase